MPALEPLARQMTGGSALAGLQSTLRPRPGFGPFAPASRPSTTVPAAGLLHMTITFSAGHATPRAMPSTSPTNPRKAAELFPRALTALALTSSVLAFGCSDSRDGAPAGGDGSDPVYAVMSQVIDADGDRKVYVGLRKSLDFDQFSLDDTREYSGVANIAGIGGRLFLSDGEQPLITQYAVTDELEWVEQGRIGFQDYPLDDNANFFGQFPIDDHTMYLTFGSSRIVWDPMKLEIKEVLEDSAIEETSGNLSLSAAGNHSSLRYSGDALQAFFYHDEDWYDFGTTSAIAVYDRETHAEKEVIEGPCPGLAVNSMDEQGNTYFSAWDYTPLFALYGVGPAPCVVRVRKDGKLDESFETDLSSLTGGRHLMNFRYVRDGWGFADVLHHELLDADFDGELDPTVLDQIWEGEAFKLWRIDLANGSAEPYEDVGASGMGWRTQTVDGRTYLFVPSTDWTSTTVFELDAAGAATKLMDVQGDVSWIRIR